MILALQVSATRLALEDARPLMDVINYTPAQRMAVIRSMKNILSVLEIN